MLFLVFEQPTLIVLSIPTENGNATLADWSAHFDAVSMIYTLGTSILLCLKNHVNRDDCSRHCLIQETLNFFSLTVQSRHFCCNIVFSRVHRTMRHGTNCFQIRPAIISLCAREGGGSRLCIELCVLRTTTVPCASGRELFATWSRTVRPLCILSSTALRKRSVWPLTW